MFSNFPEALKQFRSKLTAFEQTEILDYPEIWFLGLEAKKIEGVPGGAQNNGYDDENGSYIKVCWYSCSLGTGNFHPGLPKIINV